MSFPSQQGMWAACQRAPTIDLTITATEGTVGVHPSEGNEGTGVACLPWWKKNHNPETLSLLQNVLRV